MCKVKVLPTVLSNQPTFFFFMNHSNQNYMTDTINKNLSLTILIRKIKSLWWRGSLVKWMSIKLLPPLTFPQVKDIERTDWLASQVVLYVSGSYIIFPFPSPMFLEARTSTVSEMTSATFSSETKTRPAWELNNWRDTQAHTLLSWYFLFIRPNSGLLTLLPGVPPTAVC